MAITRAASLLVVLVLAACEGHTSMRISSCRNEGQTRGCTNACGDGIETCKGSLWSPCEVPPLHLSCTTACGEGTQLCQDGQPAGACELSPVRIPCSNTCGEGTRLCQDGQLADLCEVAPIVQDCPSICGPGTRTCADDKWQGCTAPQPKQPRLRALIRDFHITFPDMNHDGISETGIVAAMLGPDDKPIYAHAGPTSTVAGPDTFNQWYRDVPGINISTTIDIPLQASASHKGVYTYSNTEFFPVDGQLFGNEEQPHNYAFTAEIAARFRYNGGEIFTFSGDDDVFVFINRTLVIDLGGIHSSLSQTVDLDAEASRLGIAKDGIYSMHIFFAERHMVASDFVVETTISEFDVCD